MLLIYCLLCVICALLIWRERRTMHSWVVEGARARHLPAQNGAARPFVRQADSSGDLRASLPMWRGGALVKTKSALSAHATIEICLIDEMTRLPIAAGQVILDERLSGATLLDREFAGSGCVLFDADPGKYLMRLASPGYIGVVESLDFNSNQDHVSKSIALARARVLRGMVRNAAGEPEAGASVVVVARGYRKTIHSGADGGFEIQLFSNEIEKIYAFKPPHPVAEIGPVSIGETNQSFIEITLPREAPAFKVTARVFDDQARPVRGALVRILAMAGFHVTDKQDDLLIQAEQGVFGISDTDGRCTLEVLPQHDAVLQVAGVAGCEPANESLNVTGNVAKDVHLKCHPTFNVKVLDAGGRALEGASVVAETRSGTEALYATAEKGRYYVLEYPFRIYARTGSVGVADAGVTKDVWITKYQEEIRLVLGDGRLDGLVMDEAGAPIRNFKVSVVQSGENSYNADFPFLSEDGSFSLHHLPAGRVSVEVIGKSTGSGSGLVASYTENVILADGQSTYVRAVIK
jgi:hypothetical protein